MGVRRGGAKWTFAPPGNWDYKAKISGKREIRNLILIIWVNSCNDSLFADMALTLHKSQVHCFGNSATMSGIIFHGSYNRRSCRTTQKNTRPRKSYFCIAHAEKIIVVLSRHYACFT